MLLEPPHEHASIPATYESWDSCPKKVRQTNVVSPTARNGNPLHRLDPVEYWYLRTSVAGSPKHYNIGRSEQYTAGGRLHFPGDGSVYRELALLERVGLSTDLNQLTCPVIGPRVVRRKYSHFSKSTKSWPELPQGPIWFAESYTRRT